MRPSPGTLLGAVFSVFLAAGLCPPARASEKEAVGTSGAQFLKLGVNARAIALGGAYSAVADGSDSVYYNPAGLSRVEAQSASFMHSIFFDGIYYDFLSYARRLTSAWTLGGGLQYLNSGSVQKTDDFGSEVGSFSPYDMAVSLGGARKFFGTRELAVGFTGKLIQSRITETAATGAVDLGLLWHPVRKWRVSWVAQNFGPGLKYRSQRDTLPFNMKLGFLFHALRVLNLSADVNFPNDNDAHVSFGSEYRRMLGYDRCAAGRVGLNPKSSDTNSASVVSAGAGFGWRKFSVDFSWSPFSDLGNAYRFSLAVDFGGDRDGTPASLRGPARTPKRYRDIYYSTK